MSFFKIKNIFKKKKIKKKTKKRKPSYDTYKNMISYLRHIIYILCLLCVQQRVFITSLVGAVESTLSVCVQQQQSVLRTYTVLCTQYVQNKQNKQNSSIFKNILRQLLYKNSTVQIEYFEFYSTERVDKKIAGVEVLWLCICTYTEYYIYVLCCMIPVVTVFFN